MRQNSIGDRINHGLHNQIADVGPLMVTAKWGDSAADNDDITFLHNP